MHIQKLTYDLPVCAPRRDFIINSNATLSAQANALTIQIPDSKFNCAKAC